MGAGDEVREAPIATTEEVQAEDEVPQINHEYAERMDGAFVSIVFSAALPCGLVVVVTAILLGVIYGKEVDRYQGWPALHVAQNHSSTATGLWATLNGWKKSGGDAAVFVDFNPSSLTAIAALTGKIVPYLSSSIMALVAFFVARRIILISKSGQHHELPTSHQMSLLIQMLGGNSYGPLKDTVHYHMKHKKKWVSPIPHAFSALAAVTALGIIIPVVDTWFSTTVTPVKVAVVEKVTNSSNAGFGRGFNNKNPCYDEWSEYDEGGNQWEIPCNMDTYYWDQDINHTTKWSYNTLNQNEASLTMAGQSDTNIAKSWYFYDDPDHTYMYLADKRMDSSRDFRASTIALKTQCAPMISHCFPPNISSPDGDSYLLLGDDYTFQCSPGFRGELTSNGASVATGLRSSGFISAGIGFAPDSSLSRMIGNNASEVEFAAFTNPLYFGAWSLGWRVLPENDYNYTDPWDHDPNIFSDDNYSYAWMLNCSTDLYYADYDWINGTITALYPNLTEPDMGGLVSWPFVSGLPLAQVCMDFAASKVAKAPDSVTLANMWADYFSICAIDLLSGTLDPVATEYEQSRNNGFGATRVPVVPLFVLLGFKFLYCLAVLCLAIAAYHYANPAESQSVKERLTVQGLAASYFTDSPSHQQVAIKGIEQLFQPPPQQKSSEPGSNTNIDAEAAMPPEPKIGLVQTEMGGWAFVKMAASKVYDTVSPIAEKQLMSDASAGVFGADSTQAANWISLVKK